MHNRVAFTLSYVIVLLGLGTACSSITPDGAPAPGRFWGDVARPAAAAHRGPDDLIDDFLADAEPGAATVLSSADGTGTLQISVERDYDAASGRSCRRLVVVAGDERPTPRVACRDQLGAWRLLPLLRNRALPGVGSHPEPNAGRAS